MAKESMTPVLNKKQARAFQKDLDEAYSDWDDRVGRELADVLGLDSISTEDRK